MVKGGLPERVVVTAIEQAPATNFDISPDALIVLQKAGVGEAVLSAILQTSRTVARPSVPVAQIRRTNDAGADNMPSGIYVETKAADSVTRVALEPTVITRTGTRGQAAMIFSGGLAKAKWVSEVRGARASRRLTDVQPTFYFYFSDRTTLDLGTGPFAGWLSAATSPNEFVLLEMYRQKDRREIVVGEAGAFGMSWGIESANTLPLAIERLGPNAYRVRPEQPITQSGEFCFFYAAGAPSLMGAGVVGKLFDFGVDVGGK
jgi:hypothetical protein